MKTVCAGLLGCALTLGGAAQAETKVTPYLRFQAEQRYDDDLLLRQEDPGAAGQLITKLSPMVGLGVVDHTSKLKGYAAVDLLYKPMVGSAKFNYRSDLEAKKQFSARLFGTTDVRLWQVSDPTSLPRIGVARTLSPVFYGKVRTNLSYQATRRWTFEPGMLLEGAQVFEAGRAFGYTIAPSIDFWYASTRRSSFGPGYRLQVFTQGNARSLGNGVFGNYRYRIDPRTTLTAKAGLIFFRRLQNSDQGILPRVTVEAAREFGRLEFTGVLGHDLVGASGFTDALWAQYVSLIGAYGLSKSVRLTFMGSYYRNGEAPGEGLGTLWPTSKSLSGYAAEGRVEWTVRKHIQVQGSLIRLSQVGAVGVPLSRDIAAVRLILTTED